MDPAIVVALIALAGTIGNVAFNARSQAQREKKRSDAQWARYKASLAISAHDLRARLENILHHQFLDASRYGEHRDEATESTMFRFAQYFAWIEVMRRYARDPDVRHAGELRRVQELQERVATSFSSDAYGAGGFMLWREAQRAIGELMVTREDDVIDVDGVAGFSAAHEKLKPWMARMEAAISQSDPSAWGAGELNRLQDVGEALEELVIALGAPSDAR
jgi:hypothetical protein